MVYGGDFCFFFNSPRILPLKKKKKKKGKAKCKWDLDT